jgi:predicted enzyme related to lactoylglutathione lyase
MQKKVTGIGGIFFRSGDPERSKAWYQQHLGLQTDAWGTNFEWRRADAPDQPGFTQWSPMAANSSHFAPSNRDFMLNFRVEKLATLLEELRTNGVTIVSEITDFDYGRFAHIIDPDGIKIELWEPNDKAYDQIVVGRTF